jgi:hypothetical protein
MPRPGTDVFIVDGAAPGAAALDTGTAFMIGATERGPVDRCLSVASVKDYESKFGARSGGSLLYDSVSAYFSEGGGSLYVSRLAADDAATASGTFGTAFDADASSPGVWANDVTIEAVAPASVAERLRASADPQASVPTVFVVKDGGTAVERSPVLADADAAVAWADRSSYVRLAKSAAGPWDLPAAGVSVVLTGGAAGTGTVDTEAALDRFDYALGPGQVLAPGMTSAHAALLDHADRFKRCALLDAPDTPDTTALAAAVGDVYGVTGVRFAALFAPWAVYPGPVAPATVDVPYSAIEAGIIARVDRAGNPNAPAAGADGISRLAVGLTQSYTDDEREALNELGVDMAKVVYGDVRTYGYRTAAGPDDPNWLWYGNSRVVMAVAHECDAAAETYVLKQIDGRGQLLARLNKDLRGICARYYDIGALYGETPSDAFTVDTGPGVNTIDTIARGEIHAVVKLKASPAAEWVVIEVVKVPVAQPIAA